MSNNQGKGIIDSAADTVSNRANFFASDLTALETPLSSKCLVPVLMSPKQGLLFKISIPRMPRRMPSRYCTPK